MTYYIKGGSRYNEANPTVWTALNLNGFTDAKYLDASWKQIDYEGIIDSQDPFWLMGSASGGAKEFELGLYSDNRIKITTTGYEYWDGDSWENLIGAGGGGNLGDLDDVTIDAPVDNEVLAYNNATSTWINQTPAEAGLEPAFGKNTAFNKNFGTLGTEVCVGNDTRLSDARTPTAHVLATTGPHTGTLPWTDLNKTGSNLTDLATRNHNDLLNINDGDVYEHISIAQKNALHTIYSLEVHDNDEHDPNYANELIEIIAGTGLTGGGTLQANRTINCSITQYTDVLAVGAVLADDKYIRNYENDETLGTLTVANLFNKGYFDFDEIAEPATPAANDIRIWAENSQGHTVLRFAESSGAHIHTIGECMHVIGRNTSGAEIAKGKLVYYNGTTTGKHPNFSMAKADSLTTMPVIGITTDTVANNGYGKIMTMGRLIGLNTDAFLAGDELYASGATAGAMTKTFPPSPLIDQHIGVVEVKHATTGIILIDIHTSHALSDGTIRMSFSIGDGASGDVTLAFNGDGNNDGSIIWDVSEDQFVFNYDINVPNLITAGLVDGKNVSGLCTAAEAKAGIQSTGLVMGAGAGISLQAPLITTSTVDGRDISADLNQAVKTTSSPTFVGLTLSADLVTSSTVDGQDIAAMATDLANQCTTTEAITAVNNAGIVLSPGKHIEMNGNPGHLTWTGHVIDIDTTGCVQWDAVYFDGSDSVAKARANSLTTMPAIGIVVAVGKVLVLGVIRNDTRYSHIAASAVVYVDEDVAGDVNDIIPGAVGNIVQVIGHSINSCEIYVCPSLVWGVRK